VGGAFHKGQALGGLRARQSWRYRTVVARKVWDRYGNQIELTEKRWRHIVLYHPELEEFQEEVLATLQKGTRRQDATEPDKYKYLRKFVGLPFGYTHVVAVGKMVRNTVVLTAYDIEKKGSSL
jgi:hypothetical protein